jgi:hypothetical protein
MAFAVTVMAWGGLSFDRSYDETDLRFDLLETLRWATDFIIKAQKAENFLFAQVIFSPEVILYLR